jgi:hypothetical protein
MEPIQFTSQFISRILSICYKDPKFKLDADVVNFYDDDDDYDEKNGMDKMLDAFVEATKPTPLTVALQFMTPEDEYTRNDTGQNTLSLDNDKTDSTFNTWTANTTSSSIFMEMEFSAIICDVLKRNGQLFKIYGTHMEQLRLDVNLFSGTSYFRADLIDSE